MTEIENNKEQNIVKERIKILKTPKNAILTVILTTIFIYAIVYSYNPIVLLFFVLIFLPFSLINSKINPQKYEPKNAREKELRLVVNTALVVSLTISLLIFIFSFINK